MYDTEVAAYYYRFDEHAEYDLPAMINYVLKETQEQKLTYIGYSQGSVMGFAGFSTQPKLAAKVKLFIALAPVARVSHIEGAISFIAKFYREIDVCMCMLIFVYYFLVSVL